MDTPMIDNAQTILVAGAKLAAHVETVHGIPVLITPELHHPMTGVLALSDSRASRPRRRTGTANMQAIDSFADHVNRFKSAESAIFADPTARKFVAVLNYHDAGAGAEPAWNDHRTIYPCPFSVEWSAWGGGRPQSGDQDQFAAFLDAHDRDLGANLKDADGNPYPSPADLISLALSLETYSDKKAKRERDPRTGRISVSFSEESGVKGNVVIPPAFGIKIPVFDDSEPSAIEVRLRVQVDDGDASFQWQIHDSDKVLRAAFRGLIERVKGATDLPVFVGNPE